MSNYIKFIHDQSDYEVSAEFDDISTNERYNKFAITTSGLFEYSGWYTYYRYTDSSMGTLIEKGKCLLNDPAERIIYSKTEEAKKIYKR